MAQVTTQLRELVDRKCKAANSFTYPTIEDVIREFYSMPVDEVGEESDEEQCDLYEMVSELHGDYVNRGLAVEGI